MDFTNSLVDNQLVRFFVIISGDQTCYKCGEVGHMARDCSSSGGMLLHLTVLASNLNLIATESRHRHQQNVASSLKCCSRMHAAR